MLIFFLNYTLIKLFILILTINNAVVFAIESDCVFEHNKLPGTCVLASKCPQAEKDFRKGIRPTLCSFERNEPIVCCAEQNENLVVSRKSVEYCQLYNAAKGVLMHTDITTHPILLSTIRRKRTIPKDIILTIPYKLHTYSVAGGVRTLRDEFPHMAAIGWRSDDNEIEWRCGGSLISLNYVLTAAHCTNYRGPNVVRIAVVNLNSTEMDENNRNEFGISNIINHPEYMSNQFYNDIALLKLDKEVNISFHIKPACLWQGSEENLTHATVIGYGLTEYGGKPSSNLLKADLQLFDNGNCSEHYPSSKKLKEGVVSTQLCAGDPSGERDTCQGDSGGPIQTYSFDNFQKVYYIVGITSFGKACATNIPAIYTRLSSFLEWIESIVWP